jgi:hypothetical protein
MKNIVLYFFAILILVIIGLIRLPDKEGAIKTLDSNNYTSIKVYPIPYPKGAFRGGRDDVYVTGFTAKAPNGKIVTGVVTHGFFKGSTIRLD